MVKYIEIAALDNPEYGEELKMYSQNENQLYHYYEPAIGLFIAESPKVIARAVHAGYEPVSILAEKTHLNEEADEVLKDDQFLNLAEEREIPVFVCSHEVYTKISGLPMTRGMLSVMKRRTLPEIGELLGSQKQEIQRITVLDDVENPTNVGAIFRSAAALNMDAVLLTATCADPLYRRSARVAMGTVFQISWSFFRGYTPSKDQYAQKEEIGEKDERKYQKRYGYSYIKELHELGFKVCAMALTDRSVPLNDPALAAEKKLAVIMGNEGVGLPEETLCQCDYIVKIPMSHGVDSLNVAAASAVAFYALTLGK